MNVHVDDRQLPPGWSWASIYDAASVIAGVGFPESLQGRSTGEIPFYKVGDISRAWQRGERRLGRADHYVSASECKDLGGRPIPAGATVFAKIGAAIALNRRAMLAEPSLVDNNVFAVVPEDGCLSGDFLFYVLCSIGFGTDSRATTVPSLRKDDVGLRRIPVPPLHEQRRIVAAIEDHLSRLGEAVALLRRVQRNLARYRSSVLKTAVEGRLVPTEAALARAEDRTYEPATVLLGRIRDEARSRWKAQGGRGTYKEPVAPDTTDLPELPEGWCWATVDALAEVKGGITKNQKRQSAEPLVEVPYLRVANVQRGYLDLNEVTRIPATRAEIEELRLCPGDVLFNEGGDRDKLGRGWVWNGELPECIHQNHVFRARIFGALVRPKFMSWYGNTAGQRYFFRQGKQTTNLASINMTMLRALPVPVPPAAEQDRIVEAVEEALSLVEANERLVAAAIARCARLRQSILKWAFEGRLADQDPADEPAAVLLERIRAERSGTPSIRSRRGRPPMGEGAA